MDVPCIRKYSMSEEAEEHVLLRLTYLLACLLHTIITIRVVSMRDLAEAYECRLLSFHSASSGSGSG